MSHMMITMSKRGLSSRSNMSLRRLKPAATTLLAMTLVIALFCHCEASAAGRRNPVPSHAQQTITVWAMGQEGIKIAEMARRFEEEYPDIKVRTQAIPWDAAHEKLMTSVAGNIPPDVCQLGTTWMSEFGGMGALEPLESYVEQSKVASPEKFYAGSWNTNIVNGNLYGIPWYVDTRVLFYRSDILKEAGWEHPPETWDELEQCGLDLVRDFDGDGKIDRWGIALPVKDWNTFCIFLWSNGGDILNEDMTLSRVTSDEVKETFDYYHGLFDKKIAPTATGADIDLFYAFRTGYYPMFISGPWMVEMTHKEMPELDGKWNVAVMPGKKTRTSFVGGCNLVVFKQSKNKDAAWKFVEFLSRPEVQVEWYKMTTDLPAVKATWQDKFFDTKPMIKVFGEQMEDTKSPPNIPVWEQIADKIQMRMEEAILGKMSNEQALKLLDEDITRILSARAGYANIKPVIFIFTGILIAIILVVYFIGRRRQTETAGLKNIRAPYIFLIPSLATLAVFLFVPVIFSLVMSLTDWDAMALANWGNVKFVGFSNYANLLSDPIFWKSLVNTFIFVGIGVPLSIFVSLFFAVVLNEGFIKARNFFRAGYFVPVVTTIVAVAVVWRWLYNVDYGLFNWLMQSIGAPAQNWLGSSRLALPSLIIMAVWRNFGYNMVIFLAGLQAIPKAQYEAAKIDGAGWLDCFTKVTIPGLKPTTVFVTITTLIGYFQFFAEPYVMTKGGPLNSTISIVLYMYNQGFKYFKFGYASAIAYVLFIIIFIFSMIQLKLSQRGGGTYA